jgi:hypothetical protein
MDQQEFLEAQTNMSQEEKEKDDKPNKISTHNPSKKHKKKKEKGRIIRQGRLWHFENTKNPFFHPIENHNCRT